MIGRLAAILVAVFLALVTVGQACACDSLPGGVAEGSADTVGESQTADCSPADKREGSGDEKSEACGCLCCPGSAFTWPAPSTGLEPFVGPAATRVWVVRRVSPTGFRPQVFHPPR